MKLPAFTRPCIGRHVPIVCVLPFMSWKAEKITYVFSREEKEALRSENDAISLKDNSPNSMMQWLETGILIVFHVQTVLEIKSTNTNSDIETVSICNSKHANYHAINNIS